MTDLKQVYKAPTSERSDNSAGTRTKATAEEALLQLEQNNICFGSTVFLLPISIRLKNFNTTFVSVRLDVSL